MPKRRSVIYLGIDPGKSGGLVSITLSSGKARASVNTVPMPSTERDIWDWFDTWDWIPGTDPTYAVIEKVRSSPQQGVVSSFTFGRGYGSLCMALTAADISFEEVRPQVWLRAMGIPPRKKKESNSQWKNRLKAIAQQLYPKLEITLATADALLIATFCQRKHEGTLG